MSDKARDLLVSHLETARKNQEMYARQIEEYKDMARVATENMREAIDRHNKYNGEVRSLERALDDLDRGRRDYRSIF